MKFKITLTLLALLITTFNAFSQQTRISKKSSLRTNATDGLVAYYPFDENEKDFSGFGNNANSNQNVLFNNIGSMLNCVGNAKSIILQNEWQRNIFYSFGTIRTMAN